jgi:hypothetical protein
MDQKGAVMDTVRCPNDECRLPAEVLDVWEFASTAGPVEHMKTRCPDRHIYTVPTRGRRSSQSAGEGAADGVIVEVPVLVVGG